MRFRRSPAKVCKFSSASFADRKPCLGTAREQPRTAKGRGSVGSCPLTRPLATLSPQTGEGVLEFDRFLNFTGSK